jgi:hypothetical protein
MNQPNGGSLAVYVSSVPCSARKGLNSQIQSGCSFREARVGSPFLAIQWQLHPSSLTFRILEGAMMLVFSVWYGRRSRGSSLRQTPNLAERCRIAIQNWCHTAAAFTMAPETYSAYRDKIKKAIDEDREKIKAD